MMKRGLILLFFAFTAFCATGQQQTEYNKKGDEAMKRSDYSDAKMWYEEGVVLCDLYSIDKITHIWISNPDMRMSMRSLVTKCFNCLTSKGAENDTVAIRNLILYHKEGIGVPQNKTLASYWTQRLGLLSNTSEISSLYEQRTLKKEKTTDFFLGYSYSIETPFGFTFGSIGKKIGWYARFKSNFSFAGTDVENNNEGFVNQINEQYLFNKQKTNSHAGSAGVVIKWNDMIHTSVGLGYGTREVLWQYTTYEDDVAKNHGWSKNIEASHKGVLAEADFIWSFGQMYVSTGCYTVNFKYIDLNAGIGVYF